MLRYFVKRSGGEDYARISTPPTGHVWIHGDTVTLTDLRTLATQYDLELNILRDALDNDELPRVEKYDGGLYVFVTMAQRGKHGRIFTTPVLLAVKGTVFVNLSMAAVESHKLAQPSVLTQVTDTMSLLYGTFAAIVSEYEDLMQRVSRQIHDTRRRLRTHEVTNRDFIQFVTVEDNLNTYRTNLSGMLVVAQRLQENARTHADREAVEDILLYIRQLLVSTESHSQSITSIRNGYGTIANNVLNQRIKTLTVLTLLITLPNVFFGMYGMNVALPFANQPLAYFGVVGFSILVVILIYLVAKRLRIF